MNLRIKFIGLMLLVVISFNVMPFDSVSAVNGDKDVERHAVILLVPSLSFEEMAVMIEETNYPHLWQTGSYGAVNLKPDGSYSYLNNTVTIGAGKRATGIQNWNSYHGHEEMENTTVDNLMLQWFGEEPESEIIHPHVNMLVEKNVSGSYQARIGWLGRSFNENDVYTYVLGNADTRMEKVRYGSLLILDDKGYANGDLSRGVVEDPNYPQGTRMENQKILEEIKHIHKENNQSFIVVEWGDLYRIFQDEGNMESSHFVKVYRDSLRRLESLIYTVTTETNAEVWLLSPVVNANAYKNKNQLGPLWIWETGKGERKILFSSTTRRYSLVSNTDLAITWEDYFLGREFEQNKTYTTGTPIQRILEQEAVPWSYEAFTERIKEINYVFDKRGPVLSSYVSSLVGILVVVSFMIWLLKSHRWRRVAEVLLLSGILSPFLFLITGPWVHRVTPLFYVFLIFLAGVALAILIKRFVPSSFSFASFLFFYCVNH
ncbi:MAG: hypothetical protein LRY73_19630 [Bacillus sp. (in: Bacteria)]|nr:hypothetical protein [Bacillus sp. (in: firmicutes)]